MTSSVWSRRAATVAISLVVLSTVAFLPWAFHRWVLPKELVLAVACFIALFAVASGRMPRWLWFTGGIALLILLIATLSGDAPLSQLFGRWPRYEGLVTLPVYVAAAWMGARLLGPSAGAARYRALHAAAAIAAILIGAVSVLESAGLRPISSNLARPGSLLGNATDQGIVGVMLAAVLVFAAVDASSSRLRRAFLSAGLAFAVAATLLSASRAAIAVLAVLAVIAAWVIVAQSERRARLRTAVVAAVALALTAGIALAIPLTRTRLLGTSASAEQSVSTRLSIWDAAGRFLGEHPLLGAGPSGFLDALSGYSQDSWASEVGAAVTIDSPHNWLLQAAVAGGIPLMLCAIAVAALVLWTGVQSWRGERSPARIALLAGGTLAILGYGVALLTHFTTPGTTILAAFLAGAIVATVPGAAVVAVVARVRLAVVVVWVAFLGVSSAAEVPLGTAVRQAASGETAAASASFAAAQALRPWDADISSIAAQSFAAAAEAQASGAAQESVAWAQRSLELVPGSVATSKALAVGLQQSGDLVSAERVLADLSERAPGDPQVLHRLGGLQFLLGNTVSATQNLERASDLDPRNLDIWLTLRYVYQSTGDAQGASRADQAIARLGG